MPCDPNTLLEQAKCLNACIPTGMMGAVQTSLLCQIADAGGGGDGEFVLKTGDEMTGGLSISGAGNLLTLTQTGAGFAKCLYGPNGIFQVQASGGQMLLDIHGTNETLAFFDGAGANQQVSGANLTNNVTAGGSDNVIADYTSLTVYATDAAAIRNDIYQLARKLKQINDGLRAYGLFT